MANLILDTVEKKPYQVFEITMGIERVTVAIPLHLADRFEQELLEQRPSTEFALLKMIKPFAGKKL